MQLLLDYMSRHEKHLEEVLSDYKEEASKKVLEAWFQCTSTEKAEKHFRALLNEPHTNIDEIVEMAIALDDCLLGIYKEMALRAEKEEIRDVFNNLLSMETKEKQKLIRNALIIEDF